MGSAAAAENAAAKSSAKRAASAMEDQKVFFVCFTYLFTLAYIFVSNIYRLFLIFLEFSVQQSFMFCGMLFTFKKGRARQCLRAAMPKHKSPQRRNKNMLFELYYIYYMYKPLESLESLETQKQRNPRGPKLIRVAFLMSSQELN